MDRKKAESFFRFFSQGVGFAGTLRDGG